MLRHHIWAAALMLCVATATAQTSPAPALTTIEDRLYRADGSRFTGTLYIEWKSFETATTTNIPTAAKTVRVLDGVLRVALAPTTNATPRGYYRVRYSTNGRNDFLEYWAVPPSTTSLRVRDVKVSGPQSDSVPTTNSINPTLLITDVAGLRDELDLRPGKGDIFVAGRVAVINQDGNIASAQGGSADCVHVDGSSGPCGGDGGSIAFVDSETPSGIVNGANSLFTLARSPQPASSLHLYRNGVLQQPGMDYNLVGSSIQAALAATPLPGDALVAFYRTGSTTSSVRFVDEEILGGSINGSNANFTLASPPSPAASLHLYRNGILQQAGSDYDLVSSTVVFRTGAIPTSGDTLLASYRY